MKSHISGFPEFLPNEQIVFNKIVRTVTDHFESYGFVPMDTVAVERVETLLSKGNDNEIYGLYRLADANSKKDLGLRFDLTVPLARYVSQNSADLGFPFKRYQVSPVWRGERPQYCRYRQFYQCDIDIIGDGNLSIYHDAEIISLITAVLTDLHIPEFHTYLNHRKILTGFFSHLVKEQNLVSTLRLVDKIDKISLEEFQAEMQKLLINPKDITKINSFFEISHSAKLENTMEWLRSLSLGNEFHMGVQELDSIVRILKKLGLDDKQIRIKPQLARGLTYYTGIVFETSFDNISDVGSISGGGRYDDLTLTLGNEKKYPGVGATIGISRLIPKLIEHGVLDASKKSTADLLVTVQDKSIVSSYMKLANKFRALGIKTEVYLQEKPLGTQLSYANRKGIPYVVIANEMEMLEGTAILRNLKEKKQQIIRTGFIKADVRDIILGTK